MGKTQLYFGHNRLKINDLSDAANQPMTSADGRYVLVFNGEIYNHLALRQRLKLFSIAWKTQSDTETLLYLLGAFGADILPDLNGMFAFVFTDLHKQTVLVARDSFGMKPLFYAQVGETWFASSQIQGLVATGLVPSKPNISQLYSYLRYKHVISPQTFYQNIYELSAGEWRLWSAAENSWQQGKFTITENVKHLPLEPYEILARTERLLLDALQRHWVADVPVGLMLSGGVDSTLLLAMLAEMGHTNVPTFGVFADENTTQFATNDYLFAPKAARQYGAAWSPIALHHNVLHQFDDVFSSLSQPIADGAAIATFFLAKEAKKQVSVLWSGAGADEIWGGYNRHQAYYQYLKYLKFFPWDFLKKINKPLPEGYEHPLRKKFRLINKFVEQTDKNPLQTFVNFTAMSGFDCSFFVNENLCTEPFALPILSEIDDCLGFALHHDQQNYLSADVLAFTDHVAMRHAVEVRMPYLDTEIAKYMPLIAPEKLFVKAQKWVLKDLLNARKGEQYTQRAKEGFGLPLGQWLRKDEYKYLLDSVLDKQHGMYEHLHYGKIETLVQAHLQHKADYTQELVALLALFRWWKW
jgi:asparagine synthase (glutamine-hydrolysing)